MGSFNLPPLPPPAGGVPNRGSQPILPARPSFSLPSAPLPGPPVEPNIPVSSLLPYGEPVEGSEGYQPVSPVSLYSQGKEEGEPPVRKKRGWLIVMVIALVAVILGAGVILFSFYQTMSSQRETISDLKKEKSSLTDTNDGLVKENGELKEKVEVKDTFNSVTHSLFEELHYFDGKPYKDLFPTSEYNDYIQAAYDDRNDASMVKLYTEHMQEQLDEVLAMKATWEERKGNSSGTSYETTLDTLSGGYSDMVLFRAESDNKCAPANSSGCVWGRAPNVVNLNLDQKDLAMQWYGGEFAEWWFNGVAYHEFAHVLQYSNQAVLKNHVGVFDDNWELMADCYAITQYSEKMVEHGYKLGCNNAQRNQIGLWLKDLSFQTPTVIQE